MSGTSHGMVQEAEKGDKIRRKTTGIKR